MNENEWVSLFSLPTDLLRHLIWAYLDGPAACALLQTCRWANEEIFKISIPVQYSQRLALRYRGRDAEWHIRNVVIKNLWVCPHCFFVKDHNLHVIASHLGSCKAAKIAAQRALEPHELCLTCHAKDTRKNLTPWAFQYPRNGLQCRKCLVRLPKANTKWYGKSNTCLSCGPLCDICLGILFHCDYCSKDVPLSHNVTCPGLEPWYKRAWTWIKSIEPPFEDEEEDEEDDEDSRHFRHVYLRQRLRRRFPRL